ncbi:MAG: NADH-quinone oxidoreductase subunit NuoE [Spirochaetales bacterium]|nr:NADH-quinone oxidoreductase subunit NuoE [Spirochaetales bacterium]
MKKVGKIIADFPLTPESLIPILQEIQEEFNFLSEDSIKKVAAGLSLPLHHVYSVATFYNVFSLKPKGRNIVKVCMGSACHVRGAGRILEEIERSLGIKNGETSADGSFSLETVNCLGACALGPIMVINKKYNGHITPAKVEKIFQEFTSQ